MKKTSLFPRRFALALLMVGSLSGLAQAQQKSDKAKADKDEVHVRIIERDGDNVREIERTFRKDDLTDSQRDKMVMKLVDSLRATRKDDRKRQMTIIVEDSDDDRIVFRKRNGSVDVYARRPNRSNDRTFRYHYGPDWSDRTWNWENGFRMNMDSLADRMNRFEFKFPKDLDRQLARPFEDWSRNFSAKPSTIRGLDVYPNNPDRNQLNIRFTAPGKGDISIVVTTPKGTEVARREIKDFSGEFVGQINVGKDSKGTYFVTVTQNEDGAVKRVVVD